MDPNEALKQARAAIAEMASSPDVETTAEAGCRLWDVFEALDNWLSGGGFLPDDWRHGIIANLDSSELEDLERNLAKFTPVEEERR